MQIKLVTDYKSPNFKTVWQHQTQCQGLVLKQQQHLDKIVAEFPDQILNATNFEPWAKYQTGHCGPWNLILYAHHMWQTLTDICNHINQLSQDLVPSGCVFLAVNKYLLLADRPNTALPDDYNLAILELVQQNVNLTMIDYQYQPVESGNIGNFVIPDNRFLLCKN